MASDTFGPFSRLPLELRRQIYLLATPRRIVHVKETPLPDHRAHDDFGEWLQNLPSLEIDPSLAYFAHNWRHRLEEHSESSHESRPSLRQTALESFGFTTSQQRLKKPWTPSPEVPEVDPLQLWDNHALAWNFCRKGHLSSSAAIPPLLHMCRESRQVLLDHGYRLAFKTRTAGPRTWFCFRDDILFLENNWDTRGYASQILDGGDLNIGQFDPEDLGKVRRLAIGGVHPDQPSNILEVSDALRLIPRLEELLWVSVSVNKLQYEWLSAGEDTATGFKEHNPQCGCNLDYMLCEESELTEKSLAWCEPWWYQWGRLGSVQSKRRDGLQVGNSFVDISSYIHQQLTEERNNTVREEGVSAWNIPAVDFIHLGSTHLLELLRRERARCREKDEEKKQYELFWRFDGGFC